MRATIFPLGSRVGCRVESVMAKTVDVRLLNPFLLAAHECLKTMAGLRAHRERLFVKAGHLMHGDIAGVIGLSNGVLGNCVVSFPEALARQVVARLLGDEPAKLSPEMVQDGVGELANIISGGAKRALAKSSLAFDISTPTVVSGGGVQLHNPAETIAIACEFSVSKDWPETFMIELATKPSDRPG